MSAKRAFDTKDIEYPEMYYWNGRFLQFRKGTRLAKAASRDRHQLSAICYLDERTDHYINELQDTCLEVMGIFTPEQIVDVLNRYLHIIHKNRKAQWQINSPQKIK